MGQHTISGSVGFLKSKWQGAETKAGHDEGTMTMAGLVYYYNFSKRTNFYGAASWSDGKKLLDGVGRFNQVLTAVASCTASDDPFLQPAWPKALQAGAVGNL